MKYDIRKFIDDFNRVIPGYPSINDIAKETGASLEGVKAVRIGSMPELVDLCLLANYAKLNPADYLIEEKKTIYQELGFVEGSSFHLDSVSPYNLGIRYPAEPELRKSITALQLINPARSKQLEMKRIEFITDACNEKLQNQDKIAELNETILQNQRRITQLNQASDSLRRTLDTYISDISLILKDEKPVGGTVILMELWQKLNSTLLDVVLDTRGISVSISPDNKNTKAKDNKLAGGIPVGQTLVISSDMSSSVGTTSVLMNSADSEYREKVYVSETCDYCPEKTKANCKNAAESSCPIKLVYKSGDSGYMTLDLPESIRKTAFPPSYDVVSIYTVDEVRKIQHTAFQTGFNNAS